MNQIHQYPTCTHELFGALVEIVRMSVVDQFPTTRIDVDDVEHLLEALHVMRPNLPELHLFDGFVHVVRGNWREATAIFRALVDQSVGLPGSKAMLIYCLSSSGDGDWRIVANQLLDDDGVTPQARMLVHAVMARNDVEQAGEYALASGEFVEPESLKQLRAESVSGEAGNGASGSAATEPPMFDGQYLRL
ncbi:type III secretion protein HrpB1 [Burkholderia sp. PvR073]|jgi:type III secretion protein HrpB1|uniref:HrpB1 family type III secretion system apparatus protein n=1 Tax=Burkholderia TaxID=32008 RepID=UPI00158A5F9D|nr:MULTISPECIES: HrpB1 family type III secretion system apparatus protein [Burkholderia]